tara:strand:- start:483 stop:641 length:159 start_codon:yes stop_codon:yes gene_type:complete
MRWENKMEDFQKLYDCIKDVIATDEELDLNLDCIKKLKKAYNNLCEEEMEEL